MLRVGVDVGGTNTDAVLMNGSEVLATFKTSTTPDVETGLFNAVEAVLKVGGAGVDELAAVMIGTTQFTNAFVERRRLTPLAVIRLAAPDSTGVPPLFDWPADLQDQVGRHAVVLPGGYEYDGREISPLDEDGVRHAVRAFRREGIRSFAVSCAFAPVNASMETRAAALIHEEMPEAQVSLSSAFGRMGLIERENAAAMNASLLDLASTVVGSFRVALQRLQVRAPFFITQNDGTLMNAADVERHPVLTFASGPTNSMRGASFLTGLSEAVVVDIGGTTSDVGALVRGFPRESSIAVDIGGVRTNFRTPDVISLGLGGGSLVTLKDGSATVGPRSVGYAVTTEAMVFGGETLTATDIAVAAGRMGIGDRDRVAGLDRVDVERCLAVIHSMLEVGVDRMKTSAADVPLILVGGGSILVSRPLQGVSRVHVPEYSDVANAIGAAIAQVSGEVDSVFAYPPAEREAALARVRALAEQRAVAAGADPATLDLVELEETPLSYLPGDSARVKIKVVGELDFLRTRALGGGFNGEETTTP